MFLVVVAIDVVVVAGLLPLLLITMMTSTIQRFVFYMPLLVVGVMTHSYAFGPTIGTECNIYYVCVISYLHTTSCDHYLKKWLVIYKKQGTYHLDVSPTCKSTRDRSWKELAVSRASQCKCP
jgi:hypothetical protein